MDSKNLEMLVKKAKKGDAQAFSTLYETFYKDLYKTAYYVLGYSEDAQDVVSDTLLAAYETLPKLRNNQAFKSWIYKILSNKCRAMLKSYVNKNVALEEDSSTYQQDYAEIIDVKNSFNKLPDAQRLVVSLSVFGGYNSNEIAKLLDMNQNTVRSAKMRGLEQLKQFLDY